MTVRGKMGSYKGGKANEKGKPSFFFGATKRCRAVREKKRKLEGCWEVGERRAHCAQGKRD